MDSSRSSAQPVAGQEREWNMSRSWTRAKQRRYKEERLAQAARVADRLMGRKKNLPFENDDLVDALSYKFSTNLYVAKPIMSSIITGFNGV